jgi:hypothetical protein
MTPQERWETARARIADLRAMTREATPAPWRSQTFGSDGYSVLGPKGSRPGGHRLATPTVARCGHEAWEVDKANATLIATLRNTSGGFLALAETALNVHQPTPDPEATWAVHCASDGHHWPCTFVEPILNAFGIRP